MEFVAVSVVLVGISLLIIHRLSKSKQPDVWSIKKWEMKDTKKGFWAVIEKDQRGDKIEYVWYTGGTEKHFAKSGRTTSLEYAKDAAAKASR